MVFERDILRTLDSQIKNDEVIELKELAAVSRLFSGFMDRLHSPLVKSAIRASQNNAMTDSVKELADSMISLLKDAKRHSEDLEKRAVAFARVIRNKKVKLPQEINLTLNEIGRADTVRTELDNIQGALEKVKNFLEEAVEKRQLDFYYEAERTALSVISAVGDVQEKIRHVLYIERLLERMEGLPKA